MAEEIIIEIILTPWQKEILKLDPEATFSTTDNTFTTNLDIADVQEIINHYGE